MKGIKKLVIFFLFGIMLTFSVRAPLCESIDPTDSEVIIKTSANNQYVIHNYTQAVVSEAEQQPFVVNKSNNTSAECKCHFFFNRSRQREGALFKQSMPPFLFALPLNKKDYIFDFTNNFYAIINISVYIWQFPRANINDIIAKKANECSIIPTNRTYTVM